MNYNQNAHFASLPSVKLSRSVFDRSHSYSTTASTGDLIPIYTDPDILPGDTVSIDVSSLIRFQTMLTPVMGTIYAEIDAFFVPHRIIHDHFVNMMGENDTTAWTPSTTYYVPKIAIPPTGTGSNNFVGSILDYLCYPVEMTQSGSIEVSAYPLRAYCRIAEDWYRTEALSDPLNIYTGDSTVTMSTQASYVDDVPHGGKPFKVSKLRDLWTTMLPAPQRGDAITFPLIFGNMAPVITNTERNFRDTPVDPLEFALSDNTNFDAGTHSLDLYTGTNSRKAQVRSEATVVSEPATKGVYPVNLWADLSSSVGAVSVNDLRMAFQLQKLLERDALGGGRYKEVVRAHFSTDVPDARLMRAEYLGGKRFPINVSQVTNTAQTSTDPLGDVGAYSVTSDVNSLFTKSFTEHGTLMIMLNVRAERSYCQGLLPYWKRNDRYSFYWPVLANVGEQPYEKDGLFLGASGTFGYGEAWADYRTFPSQVTGFMRPYVSGSLGSWNLADDYASAPSLSDAWIREDPANVDRCLAVQSTTAPQYWADFYFKVHHARAMPVFSIPGLIDHH